MLKGKRLIDARQTTASFEAYVDRIEEGLAVIVASDGSGVQFELPLGRLPQGAKAGDHLIIGIQLDQESTEAALQRVAKLQRELKRTSDSDTTQFKL